MTVRMLLMCALVAALSLTGAALPAKDKKANPLDKMPKPGPEHRLLAAQAGTFEAKVKSWFGPGEPKTSSGTMSREMIMDGRYLHERFKGDFGGMPFKGMGLLGYDVPKKKYVMAWVDNFATGIELSYGTYSESTKSFTFVGEADNPDFGGKMKTRDVLKIVSPNEEVFEMYRTPAKTGKEFKVMEITYTRKK